MSERNDVAAPAAFEAGWLRSLARRYQRYAAEAEQGGAADAAAAFEDLVRELEAEVKALGVAPVEMTPTAEDDPDQPPHRMDAHDVWQLAVDDRERLFETLSARAGLATSAAVLHATEERARAQLDHLARWRLERRRAARRRPSRNSLEIHTLGALEAFHAAAKQRLMQELRPLATRLDRAEAPALAAFLDEIVDAQGQRAENWQSPGSIVRAVRMLLEDNFDALLDIAEQTSDHATQARAQALAEAQLARLRLLRGINHDGVATDPG